MEPVVVRLGPSVTLIHGDCLDVLPVECDAVVTDPPYGINWRPRVNHQNDGWTDNEAFDPAPCLAVGRLHLFWGANYFADKLPPSQSWFVWVKRQIGSFVEDPRTYASVELAWSDYGTKARHHVQVWDGGMRQGDADNRTFCHPSQKPIELMQWCLPDEAKVICDPYMGSGTTGIACIRMGRSFIGIERDATHFETARKRMEAELMQGTFDFGGGAVAPTHNKAI
jgi:site-specific DNA-methyltransferase (adenine-specific)